MKPTVFSSKTALGKMIATLLVVIVILVVFTPIGIWYSTNNPSKPEIQQPTQSPILTGTPTLSPNESPIIFSPTPTNSEEPSPTATQAQESPQPTISGSPSPTEVPSYYPPVTSYPSPSPTLTAEPTQAPIPTPTATPPPTPSPTPTPTPNPTPTPHPPQGNGPSITENSAKENSTLIQTYLNTIAPTEKSSFQVNNSAALGNWSASVTYSPLTWEASARVRLGVSVNISREIQTQFRGYWSRIDNACILITAERDFDPQGNQHVPWDNTVSTILTPSGLPIEGGGSAALSRYNGYTRRSPVDVMFEMNFSRFFISPDTGLASGMFYDSFDLPNNIPPGIYRLRLDFGFKSGTRYMDFNNNTIGARTTYLNNVSCVYTTPALVNGWDLNGTWIDASQIVRKSYWVLLWDYNSNGYRGVVALEDQNRVAISPRNMIHDAVILPKVDVNGNAISYNIEPMFLLDNDNTQRNIPIQYRSGQWTVRITLPNGTIVNLGSAIFAAKRGNGATTQNSTFTAWRPPLYGNYTVDARGWIEDMWGNRYIGGGTFTFWIAQRLTVATATFQGMPYNVGNRYGRDLAFNPPVPANVSIKASLFQNSDPNNVTSIVCNGTATRGGLFGAAQGMVALTFNAPGEYFATVTATYNDSQGMLWVASMTHAGVVYPINSTIDAHGKKLTVPGGKFVDRGETKTEGYVAPNGTSYLQHINFPYNFGDVLLIATEFQGANKIEPVLTYTVKGVNSTYDSGLQSIGRTNLVINTSNSLSPEMFPEYITNMQYFYAAAPQPGFNARFIVADDYTRAPYWPTSNNNFGGEYGASSNGDIAGTTYRLLGGAIVKNKGQIPAYAGYQATAFIMPKGTNNNRVIGPGDEDLPTPDGKPARFLLVPVRPGSVYQLNMTFSAVLQIDPILPCNVTFTFTAPDNTTRVATGQGDQFGYFASALRWTLDQPGVWTYNINATWNGFQGSVPGLPEKGGWIYVMENGPPPAPGLTLRMPVQQTFSAVNGLNVTGNTTASKVFCAAIIPGAILEEVILPVSNGTFLYNFSPQRMANKIQTYDIINMVNGNPQIGKIVHLTFFTEEKTANGTIYHSFARVVLRGTTATYVKER